MTPLISMSQNISWVSDNIRETRPLSIVEVNVISMQLRSPKSCVRILKLMHWYELLSALPVTHML